MDSCKTNKKVRIHIYISFARYDLYEVSRIIIEVKLTSFLCGTKSFTTTLLAHFYNMKNTIENYIFWDIENCKLESIVPEDNAIQINQNIESVVKCNFMKVERMSYSFTKYIFLSIDSRRGAYRPSNKQLDDLQDLQYHIISYVKKVTYPIVIYYCYSIIILREELTWR